MSHLQWISTNYNGVDLLRREVTYLALIVIYRDLKNNNPFYIHKRHVDYKIIVISKNYSQNSEIHTNTETHSNSVNYNRQCYLYRVLWNDISVHNKNASGLLQSADSLCCPRVYKIMYLWLVCLTVLWKFQHGKMTIGYFCIVIKLFLLTMRCR